MKHTTTHLSRVFKKAVNTIFIDNFFLERVQAKRLGARLISYILLPGILLAACSKKSSDPEPPPAPPAVLTLKSTKINGQVLPAGVYNINTAPVIKYSFSAPVDKNSVTGNFSFEVANGTAVPFNPVYENNDSTISIQATVRIKLSY